MREREGEDSMRSMIAVDGRRSTSASPSPHFPLILQASDAPPGRSPGQRRAPPLWSRRPRERPLLRWRKEERGKRAMRIFFRLFCCCEKIATFSSFSLMLQKLSASLPLPPLNSTGARATRPRGPPRRRAPARRGPEASRPTASSPRRLRQQPKRRRYRWCLLLLLLLLLLLRACRRSLLRLLPLPRRRRRCHCSAAGAARWRLLRPWQEKERAKEEAAAGAAVVAAVVAAAAAAELLPPPLPAAKKGEERRTLPAAAPPRRRRPGAAARGLPTEEAAAAAEEEEEDAGKREQDEEGRTRETARGTRALAPRRSCQTLSERPAERPRRSIRGSGSEGALEEEAAAAEAAAAAAAAEEEQQQAAERPRPFCGRAPPPSRSPSSSPRALALLRRPSRGTRARRGAPPRGRLRCPRAGTTSGRQ